MVFGRMFAEAFVEVHVWQRVRVWQCVAVREACQRVAASVLVGMSEQQMCEAALGRKFTAVSM